MAAPFVYAILLLLFSFICLYLLFWRTKKQQPKWILQPWRAGSGQGLPPGPPALPLLGNMHQLLLQGSLIHQSLYHLANKYGPIMYLRLGSVPTVVVSSPAMAAQVLKVHDQVFASRPKTSAVKYMLYDGATIALGPYDDEWRLKRKICSLELFTPKRLRELKHIRTQDISALLRSIHSHSTLSSSGEEAKGESGVGSVNLSEMLPGTFLNVVSRMMLSKRIASEECRELGSVLEEFIRTLGAFAIEDFIPQLQWLDGLVVGVKRRMKSVHQRLDCLLEKIIREHELEMAASNERRCKDLLDNLLSLHSADLHNCTTNEKNKENCDHLSRKSIKAVVLDMLLGGTDTSSHTIIWTLAELIRNPKVLKTAQDEVDSVVGYSRKVHESDLEQLNFLHAIVKETFRLHPTVPLLVPRESMQSCTIAGYNIPQATRVIVNAWAIGHDSHVWEDPLEFNPHRFINESQPVEQSKQGFELIPFGGGRRGCPGMSLGLCMVHYTLASLIHCFDWTLPKYLVPIGLDLQEAPGVVLLKKEDLIVCPLPRRVIDLYMQGNLE